MAKKVTALIKLQVKGGIANPSPPVGPALGQHGVNIMGFCKDFNAQTQDRHGITLPVIITVYADKSFTFTIKEPPATYFIKKALGIEKGSAIPQTDKVGKLSLDQLRQIAKDKNMLRGQIVKDNGTEIRNEDTNFEGAHFVECYIIKDGICVARDRIDVPIANLI